MRINAFSDIRSPDSSQLIKVAGGSIFFSGDKPVAGKKESGVGFAI